MDDAALLALWSSDVTDAGVASPSATMEFPSPSPTVDWDDILPLGCNRPQGFAVFNNVRKAVGRVCYESLSSESQKRLVANVPVLLSYGRASAFSGSEGCECVFEDMEQIFRGLPSARDTVICKCASCCIKIKAL